MKIAIVHDYLVTNGGAERCLRALLEVFPIADVYTLFFYKKRFKYLEGFSVKTSFFDKIPFLKKRHDIFLPLYPFAVKSLPLRGYDLILSSSWAWTKNINKNKETCHICYCHTPIRFVYVNRSQRLKKVPIIIRSLASYCVDWIKRWDLENTPKVDYFIAACSNVEKRIKEVYGRDSFIVHPPLNTQFFKPQVNFSKGEYYLVSSRLVTFKRVDIIIEAFNKLQLPLKVAGGGLEYESLRQKANGNIAFLGHVSKDERLLELYQNCKALIFPQEDDWGISALEAQSCGRPVIAFAKGGALESVIEGETGHFFYEQTPEAIIKAVKEFEKMSFDARAIRKNVLKYDREIFKTRIREFINKAYNDFKSQRN